jgi:splicing factor, arginine/serine-rich 16
MEHIEKQSKKKSNAGAAIAYTYEDNDTSHQPFVDKIAAIETAAATSSKFDDCVKDDSDSDLDMDMSIDINKIGHQQGHELNTCGRHYGMKSNDFYSFLTRDADEMESLRLAREEEQEKIIFSGRKSRRERRAQRERRYAVKGTTSPPSYAAKDDVLDGKLEEKSVSRSPTPENSGKVVFITSFGGEEELQPHPKISINFNKTGGGASSSKSTAGSLGALLAENRGISYADTVKQNLSKLKDLDRSEMTAKKPLQYQGRRHSRSRSRERYGRRYGPNKGRRYSRSHSRSRRKSRSSSRRRWRSRSRSSGRRRRATRSRSNVRNSRRRSSSSSSSRSSSGGNARRRPTHVRSKSPPTRKPVIKYSASPLPKFPPPPRSKSKSVEGKPNIAALLVKPEPHQPVVQPQTVLAVEPVPPIKRYYGRKREDSTSDSSEKSVEQQPSSKDIKVEPMDTSEPG